MIIWGSRTCPMAIKSIWRRVIYHNLKISSYADLSGVWQCLATLTSDRKTEIIADRCVRIQENPTKTLKEAGNWNVRAPETSSPKIPRQLHVLHKAMNTRSWDAHCFRKKKKTISPLCTGSGSQTRKWTVLGQKPSYWFNHSHNGQSAFKHPIKETVYHHISK